MKLAVSPTRLGEHENAFGFLRLLFASLVIVSHVPEVVDADARRELLHMLTGTITFGRFAVWGFFIISGYLITGSLLNSRSIVSYFVKRSARIYPAFIVASLTCLVLVVPLSGGSWGSGPLVTVIGALIRTAILARPIAHDVFPGQNFNDDAAGLNGAMWTIQYEFLCYLLVVVLLVTGVFRRPALVPALSIALLAVGTFAHDTLPAWLSRRSLFPGDPEQLFILPGIFLAGASFYVYRSKVRFGRIPIILTTIAFVACLSSARTAAFGYAAFGSYLIFAAAKAGAGT